MFISESNTDLLESKCDKVKIISNFIYNSTEMFGYIKSIV